jgi:2-polyprenyl-3-methyl-5-hydroxy-6-metoxy-1,4-benzoquinol methylase
MGTIPSYTDYYKMFAKYGDPGNEYLYNAFPRFCITKRLLTETVAPSNGSRILDIGSHWLHHAVLYAMDGFSVTGADICYHEEIPVVKGISQEHNIKLIYYKDLSNPHELEALPENAFDVILFTEILEHITFNPVAMWKSLYRLLSPGGRIVITTPNYFNHSNGRILKDIKNCLSLRSAGLSIREIIEVNTFGHHWRIYSARDIMEYFSILSSDFKVSRVEYFDGGYRNSGLSRLVKHKLQQLIPFLRDTLYFEIELPTKKTGITAQTHW